MTDSKPRKDRDEQEQMEWYERTRYQLLLFAATISLFVIVGAQVLDWYINPHTSTQRQALVQALGLITAGVAGAVGIFFTWRGQSLARGAQEHNQKNTQTQLENAQEELRLTRQGQITERFTRAIEQLGATDDEGKKKLEIRLGGIYALERIDKESPNRAYHSTVMEVLTAYVRENSRWDRAGASTPILVSPENLKQDKGMVPSPARLLPRLPADIQAILDVLKRREEDSIPKENRVNRVDRPVTFDLRGVDLGEAKLSWTNLSKADLSGTNLSKANLWGAGLYKAFAQEANLQEAFAQEANFQRAHLVRANLNKADLVEANLQGTAIWDGVLQRANLQRANLQGADLREADLQGADLRGADLQRTFLRGAVLLNANLQGANLLGAFLQGANLQENPSITQRQINGTIGSNEIKLPEGLNHPDLWRKSVEEQLDIIEEHNNRAE